jgi:glucan phosphoethanolaminetransferase (alkaline phosphatase superfamily)
MFKTFNAVFGVLFVICAALQWNDPDLYLWIPLYLLAALSCALAYAQVPALRLNLAVIAIYLIYAAYLFVAQDGVWSWMFEHQFDSLTQSMLASAPWIENTREFGGLVIMAVVCAINLWVQRQTPKLETELDEQVANS